MDKPHKSQSLQSIREHGIFTASCVAADPDTKGMETALAAETDTLKIQCRMAEDLCEAVQRKLAVIVCIDQGIDAFVTSFELRLFDLVGKKRKDPLYKRYFPKGLRFVTQAGMRFVQPALVNSLITTMNEDLLQPGIGPIAQEFHPKISAKLIELNQAELDMAAAEQALAHMRNKTLQASRARWEDEYVNLHGALKSKFPRASSRVESYFLRFGKERKPKTSAKDSSTHPARPA